MHATQRHHIGASTLFRQYPFQLVFRTAEKETNPEPGILGSSLEPQYYFKTSRLIIVSAELGVPVVSIPFKEL
ncbi:unnamed protein product [Echinostoma caproni]|uniref:Uncharacterized protein n=1 Tax=Echinostoma caproni TaxID=27848 RepID=A0A183BGG7_9TREM|nr:unnamed protein product [Echinostoma caproni]